MSDRCYMQVICCRQDRHRCEACGFYPEFTDTPTDGPVVELVDSGADYGQAKRLPTDAPFLASHDTTGSFGGRRIACDGRRTADVPAISEGFIVEWDVTKKSPTAACLARIPRYFARIPRYFARIPRYFAVFNRTQRRLAAKPRSIKPADNLSSYTRSRST